MGRGTGVRGNENHRILAIGALRGKKDEDPMANGTNQGKKTAVSKSSRPEQ